MQIKIILSLVSVVFAGPVIRQQTKPVQIYSKTGKFMSIQSSGIVRAVNGKLHENSLVDIVPVGKNRFQIRGSVTGLYLQVDKRQKIRTTIFDTEATVFSEEILEQNNFRSFRLADNEDCKLSMNRKGYKVVCSKGFRVKNISFLPKKSHIPKSFYRGAGY